MDVNGAPSNPNSGVYAGKRCSDSGGGASAIDDTRELRDNGSSVGDDVVFWILCKHSGFLVNGMARFLRHEDVFSSL